MDDDSLKKLRARCILYACKKGYPEIAEDFAQDATLKLWRGRKTNIEKLLIDFLRTHYGKTGSKAGFRKVSARRYPLSLEWAKIGKGMTENLYLILDGLPLEPVSRAMLVLNCVWGFTLEEIGQAFGMTNSAVHQRLRTIGKKIDELDPGGGLMR